MSNIGPLLWNVFQNDLVYNTDKSSFRMRADDRPIYVSYERMEGVERTLTDGKGKSQTGTNSIC